MNYMESYNSWLSSEVVDESTRQELLSIKDKDSEIYERFYRSMEFGTGGIRGIMAAGTNNMNIYTVRQTTEALARYITKEGAAVMKKGVVIAYDCRNNSREFAKQAAIVLAANGIKVYLFEDLRPTPMLSFAVRHLKATAGIVITASHNPKEYNGYKVYWDDGGQLPPHVSDKVLAFIAATDIFSPKLTSYDDAVKSGQIQIIGKEVDEAYYTNVLKQMVNGELIKQNKDFPLIYTPFHGSGNIPVREILKRAGFTNVTIVPEQEKPDGNFSTMKSPNPEDKDGFALAIELAKQKDISLIIATDPDSDRVGIVVRDDNGEYIPISGNQVGALLTDYMLSQHTQNGTLPENPAIISTIVSTRVTEEIAKSYGATYIDTLTGFKFIGEKIYEFEQSGSNSFVFGFEESYGYLAGTYCRDKDAVVASMLIGEMALYYNTKGMNLAAAVQQLFKKYGYFREATVNIFYQGSTGAQKMKECMARVRGIKDANDVAGFKIVAVRDYLEGKRYAKSGGESTLNYPKSDVIYVELEGGINFIIRPSGTEPKIKIYLLIKAADKEQAQHYEAALSVAVKELLN